MLLFFGSELLLTARFPVALLTLLYVATVAAGYISLLTAGTWISRLLKNQLMDDVFNDENESFMQERRLIANEYSVNLPTRFRYQRKTYSGWINVINPFRASLILGTPGVGYEVRGNGEMFPLNGPCWSLFFEYIGNILYALFIRRLSNKALTVFVVLLGVALAAFAVFNVSTYGNIGVGWTLDGVNFLGGSLRMLFPFSLGMLMSRNFKPMKVKGAFWICTIALIALFSVPYLEGLEPLCMNGVYEAFCVIVAFPIILWIGASGTTTDKQSTKICKFLGDISYPVYVIHYPLMYLFYAWLIENQLYTLGETWHVALCVFILSIILAYLCLKLYDEPIRKYLAKRFLSKK